MTCPRCAGFLVRSWLVDLGQWEIRCVQCGHRLPWVVIPLTRQARIDVNARSSDEPSMTCRCGASKPLLWSRCRQCLQRNAEQMRRWRAKQ
jgi:hypothetical protein